MMNRQQYFFQLGFLLIVALLLHGCGSSETPTTNGATGDAGINLPLVTPPVRAATPQGLGGGASSSLSKVLNLPDFRSRFFTTGPTDIFTLLTTLDDLITTANTLSTTSTSTCLTQTPVSYTITPYGQTVTMYGQCYNSTSPSSTADPGFFQFGVNEGVTYIYAASGAERIAAIVTPVTGTTGQYAVQAWIGLGYLNTGTWDSMSYGVMQLTANSNTRSLELSVAGIGFGYCGLQLISDGTNIFSEGSSDMGSTCNAADTLCVAAVDGITPASCGGLSFALSALGRKDVPIGTNGAAHHSGVSQYPAAPLVTLTGTSGDDLYFGPLTPTTGVNLL